jgi:hypothetical protein
MAFPRPDPADLKPGESAREQRFWEANISRLLKHYPDEFGAVHDNNVVAARSDLLKLLDDLEARGLSQADVWVKFLTGNPRRVLL